MCLGMNDDRLGPRRALRLDVQPQFRRPSGSGRPHPSGQPDDGGGSRHRGAFRRRASARMKKIGLSDGALMQPFRTLTGLVAPLDRANVDTDAIIPKQFLKSIARTGFGPNLFDAWRYLDRGEPAIGATERALNPEFVLNQPRYQAGADPARAAQFRLWKFARARALGPDRLRFPRADRAVVCRYFLQQLLQERPAADRAGRSRSRSAVSRGGRVSRLQTAHRSRAPDGVDRRRRRPFSRSTSSRFASIASLNGLDEIGLTLQHADEIHDIRSQAPRPPTVARREACARAMKIALLPGDGIGPEIIAEAEKLLEHLRRDGSADRNGDRADRRRGL